MEMDKTVGRNKIAALFDSGTFVETGAYLGRADGSKVGAICGYGAINGKLTYAFVQDGDRQKGAFDALQAKKIAGLYEMALKNGAPVIGVFDSIGAYVGDGASALSAYGTLLGVIAKASGAIPQIALVTGVCSGMSASAAAMFDVVVTVKDQSSLSVNAPFLIGKEVGNAEFAAENGLSSILAASESEAFAKARELIALLPANCEEGVSVEEIADDVNRLVAVEGLTGKALASAVADGGAFIELADAYAKELTVGFARIGGVCCGIVASNANVNGGVITASAARKAAKLIGLCDSFGLPVITLVDSEGVAADKKEESSPLASALGTLAMAYANADTAKITVVVGKAYGAAFTLLGSRALGADLVYAVKDACISVLSPDSAVAFLWNDRITEERSRADLVLEWKNTCASAETAAADGNVDDLIDATELRARICSAVYMLLCKGEPRFGMHSNLPL